MYPSHSPLPAVLLAIALSACGGGSANNPPATPSPEPIKQALDNIAANLPQAPAFRGAFVTLNGKPIGWVEGSDKHGVVAYVASVVMDAPTAYTEAYKALLSAEGLPVVVHGESIGKSAISGMTLYAPNSLAYAMLGKDGLLSIRFV